MFIVIEFQGLQLTNYDAKIKYNYDRFYFFKLDLCKRTFMMSIPIASDHAGFQLKKSIVNHFHGKINFIDFGTYHDESVDYPDFAMKVVESIIRGEADMGILICGSGNGMSIFANKFPEIRCALAWNREIARLARLHNNANILALPGRFIEPHEAFECVNLFFTTQFEGERHQKRLDKITSYVKNFK